VHGWQNEAKRFLAALSQKAELRGSEEFTVAELFDLADTLELAVPDVSDFISQLNDAGDVCMQTCTCVFLCGVPMVQACNIAHTPHGKLPFSSLPKCLGVIMVQHCQCRYVSFSGGVSSWPHPFHDR